MRKEVNAAYRRPHLKNKRKVLKSRADTTMRPAIKLVALVCILGIAAYLLFSPKNTEPQQVNARQSSTDSVQTAPPTTLDSHDPSLTPTSATQAGTEPVETETTRIDSSQWISGLAVALEQASTSQQQTATRLMHFASTGTMSDIRDLTADDVRSLAEMLTTQLGKEAVAAAVEAHLGLPAGRLLAFEDVPEALTQLFRAVQTETDPSTARPLVFSDRVEPDGTVTGNVHVIPAGTRRVYASFENAGALQGLDRVLAVWRNPSDDRMVFTEYEPVRPGAVYNYVWLQLDDGWPAGFYQVDLFHPAHPTQLLASRAFNVR